MTLIDGKAIGLQVRNEIRDEVAAWVAQGHEPPGLATVLVGDDPASAVYVGGKQKASAEAGIRGFDHRLKSDATHDEVNALLEQLNADPSVNGILLQLPTPPQVDGPALTEIIDPRKDVGLPPARGRPRPPPAPRPPPDSGAAGAAGGRAARRPAPPRGRRRGPRGRGGRRRRRLGPRRPARSRAGAEETTRPPVPL